MENASKALLMAAEMLIAVLVASMFALLFSTMSDYSRDYEQIKQTQEIQAFNTQFTQYIKEEGSTAQDVVSTINLAKYYNERDGMHIEIKIGPHNVTNYDENQLIGCMIAYPCASNISIGADEVQADEQRFFGTIGYDGRGKISQIQFTQNDNVRFTYEVRE